jgi:polyhydroxybutyrate depolymerase
MQAKYTPQMRRSTTFAVALGISGALIFGGAIAACGSSSDSSGAASTNDAGAGSDTATTNGDAGTTADASLVAARPYNFKVPTGYDKTKPTPLVIMLHGYSASGVLEETYFQLSATSDAQTFLYAYPDGTKDPTNNLFWNADDACCDFYSIAVDDVAYVNAIIDDVQTKYNVDPKRIFVVGHSNGAFMSHRLACDSSDRIAAIAALAGEVWNDPSKCNPTAKISILGIHGDADTTIFYDGGIAAAGFPPYPPELQTMSTWAAKNGCTGALTATGTTLDLDSTLAGNETVEKAYTGCPAGIDVKLWTIQGGGHIPSLTHPTWGDSIWAFFAAHPKP